MAGTKTYIAKKDSVDKKWYLVDASGQILGRMATTIATTLMGKHRPTYTPNVDSGDYVIVINADKIAMTGKKWEQKEYTWYTGYPGLRTETAATRLQRRPEQIVRDAVRRMLPKNKLGTAMLSKLKIYAGSDHPHQAQNPEPLDTASDN